MPKSDFALDLELEALARREPLHGRNHGDEHRTADGHELYATSLAANLWPGWQVTRQLTLYVGGGAGGAYARALGDGEPTWAAQVGAGARWNVTPALSLELAERTVWIGDVRLDHYRATYGAVHGLMLGLRWEIKN